MEEISNYIPLACYFPLRKQFAYVDYKQYKADDIFIQNGLTVYFKGTYIRGDFVVVIVQVNSSMEENFKRCMCILHNRLLFAYGEKYTSVLSHINDLMH